MLRNRPVTGQVFSGCKEGRFCEGFLPVTQSLNPMQLAIKAAEDAALRGEVPVGAVITGEDGAILAIAGNRCEQNADPSAHAEMLAMRDAAGKLDGRRLSDATLWVTLEPCPMCAAAAVHFRVKKIIFGAYDPKGGGIDHGPRIFATPACLHRPEVIGGVQETENAALLRRFFQSLRTENGV
jgi:cytosine deaminase